MTLPSSFAALLEVPLSGRTGTLCVPTVAEIHSLIPTDAAHDPASLEMIAALLMQSLLRIDGQSVSMKDARVLARDDEVVRTFLGALKQLLEVLRDQGKVIFVCPHCRSGERAECLSFLGLDLAARPWPIFQGPFLAMPSLSQPLPRGTRPASPPGVDVLRFELPSAALGLEGPFQFGTLGAVDPNPLSERDAAAWDRWAPRWTEPPPGRRSWATHKPGFRGLLRLALALEGGVAGLEVDPALLERLPAPDWYFLDALYALAHNTRVPHLAQSGHPCPNCGKRFLPVLK